MEWTVEPDGTLAVDGDRVAELQPVNVTVLEAKASHVDVGSPAWFAHTVTVYAATPRPDVFQSNVGTALNARSAW